MGHTALEYVNFHQLEIFFSAVEEESFTKAAAQLHMTQSAVSKSIARLEEELELTLFTRHYRELHVTQAGRELYRQWHDRVRELKTSYEAIRSSVYAADKTLRLGVTDTTDLRTYFWPLLDRFRQQYPECEPDLDSDHMQRLADRLEAGERELIFVPDFMHYRLEERGFSWRWAARAQLQVYLTAEHPLAAFPSLTFDQIKSEKIVILNENDCPENLRFLRELFAGEGCEVQVSRQSFHTADGIEKFYRSRDGILLADAYFRFGMSRSDIVRRPLKGYENGIICGFRAESSSVYLKKFLAVLPEFR